MFYVFAYLYVACFGYYLVGMLHYNKNNNHCKKTNHDATYMGLLKAISDEEKEFNEAETLIETILEFNDVCHTWIKFFGYIYDVPDVLTLMFAYVFCPLTAMKHGFRYWKHGCIRNLPHCMNIENKNHVCAISNHNIVHDIVHVIVILCLI